MLSLLLLLSFACIRVNALAFILGEIASTSLLSHTGMETSVCDFLGTNLVAARSLGAAVDSSPFNEELAEFLTQTFSVAATYVGCVIYFDQPRGELFPSFKSALIVKPSRIENAGLGLFSTVDIPKDTVLGTYPGVLCPIEKYIQGKLQDYPQSSEYIWRFSDNAMAIDPTNEFGVLEDVCYGGSSDWIGSHLILKTVGTFLGRKTMLARTNEPPPTGDCNVNIVEDLQQRKITFVTSSDVSSGEELYVDYGTTYDRSTYRKEKSETY